LQIIGCGFLIDSIYCIGGIIYGDSNKSNDPDNSINVLNLTTLSGTSTSDLQNKWTQITPNTTDVDTVARVGPHSIALPDGKRMLFYGGYRSDSPIKDQTIVYDASSNTWSKYANYSEEQNGQRQMYL
jgi:hypothetical protein